MREAEGSAISGLKSAPHLSDGINASLIRKTVILQNTFYLHHQIIFTHTNIRVEKHK